MPPFEAYIWYEKFRPKCLDDMILSDDYRAVFNGYIQSREIPHLLFIGPPGSGKTTLARILVEHIGAQVLTLNASGQDRGIDTIKGKVKQFASSLSLNDRLKVVFMDEADFLTGEGGAQTALRNTMEVYSATCRFILTANYSDKIIPALKSRCTLFNFDTVSKATLLEDLQWVLQQENVQYNLEHVQALIDRHYPDVRTVINNLQAGSANGVFNPAAAGGMVNVDVEKLGTLIAAGKITQARRLYTGMSDYVWLYRWLFDSFAAVQFLDETRTAAALIIAQYLYQDSNVLDREINFTACLLELIQTSGAKIDWR